jgi:hypothetical protein
MKNFIKFTILLVVLGIFAFSSNPTITKARNFTIENSKKAYNYCTSSLKESKNETVKKYSSAIL